MFFVYKKRKVMFLFMNSVKIFSFFLFDLNLYLQFGCRYNKK